MRFAEEKNEANIVVLHSQLVCLDGNGKVVAKHIR